MSGFRPTYLIAGIAAFGLVAAAPPAPERVKRASTRMATQTGAEGLPAAGGGAAAAAGGGILQGSWLWALGGIIAAGGLTAVAISNSDDPPASPAS
ncbi:hypothetical protein [Novosphingobium sp. ST904]|uniref:hypothetical protein n=1 Tax=Novosphingobium sp. ST904 TaxID=1684385 RepID=UPI0006C86F3B|nr:hypothetical protein [Novosphingobium sp. ST904]KPH58056.1 hypothetical protein ADT71_26310 [Novosphingobium sp. ST904]TCM41527.1 hypothetical protein EDF59_103279 [Novosphingobium sp. ST904]